MLSAHVPGLRDLWTMLALVADMMLGFPDSFHPSYPKHNPPDLYLETWSFVPQSVPLCNFPVCSLPTPNVDFFLLSESVFKRSECCLKEPIVFLVG